jgi:hypothetical protein
MKAIAGDQVAIMKSHPDTDTPFIFATGVLTALDQGRKSDDERANAEEGDCPAEVTVAAPGWSLVTKDDGTRLSVKTKSLKILTQAVRVQHDATMQAVAEVVANRKQHTQDVVEARKVCKDLGLDVEVENLSDDNALKISSLKLV